MNERLKLFGNIINVIFEQVYDTFEKSVAMWVGILTCPSKD